MFAIFSFGNSEFLHMQIVNQTAFILSQSNNRDEIAIYLHKTELFTLADEGLCNDDSHLMKLIRE